MNDWIPIGTFPLINFFNQYEVTTEDGRVSVYQGKAIPGTAIAIRPYNPTPYVAPVPIKAGDGWRLLEEGEVPAAGDCLSIDGIRWIELSEACHPRKKDGVFYRRRIEPAYRPFACAAEYAPHRERWVTSKRSGSTIRLVSFSDDTDWERYFKEYEFEDGTPFGVETQP